MYFVVHKQPFLRYAIEDNVFLFALVTGFGIYLSSRYTSGIVPFSFPEHHEKSTRARGKGDPILFTVVQFFGGPPQDHDGRLSKQSLQGNLPGVHFYTQGSGG